MKNIIIYIVIALSVISFSCSTEFDVNGDWEDITIVYGLLNIKDSVHYIKVNKAFLGEQDAAIMAQVSDSLYYQDITVTLEEWEEGADMPHNIIELEYNDEIDKDPGYFANVPNVLYSTTHNLNSQYDYKLVIQIPGKEYTVSATTKLLDTLKVCKPTISPQEKVSLSNTYITEWQSTENARLYEVELHFHYLKVINGDTTEHSLDYELPTRKSNKLDGGEEMWIEISGSMFMSYVASMLEDNDNIRYLADKHAMDFTFTIADDDMNTYIEVMQPSSGIVQEKPSFTNISNGIGLFASRYNKTIYGKGLSNNTLDSLAYGLSTKHLNFADQYDMYYHTNIE